MYVAMHFAAAAQVLLRLKYSFQLLAFSFQLSSYKKQGHCVLRS